MQAEKLIRQYLQESKMMQLATVSGDQPWCCSVLYTPTENLDLYWISLPDTRHSRELMNHPKIAATIPVRHTPGEPVVGIAIEGIGRLVDDPAEIKLAAKRYADYLSRGEEWYEDFIAGKNPHRLYRLKPKSFALFDAEHFPESPRQEFRP